MKRIILLIVFCATFFTFYNSALATPLLQLDIVGGSYDQNNDTITGMGDLIAILNPASGEASKVNLTGDFILVASWDTATGGSLIINGGPGIILDTTNNVPTGGFWNHDEVGSYGTQLTFQFSQTNATTLYNTEDNPGGFVDDSGTTALFQMFTIATTGPFAPIHFDLFAETLPGINPDIVFAPPSHDATHAPEPATMFLFGTGLAGLGVFRRKFKKE